MGEHRAMIEQTLFNLRYDMDCIGQDAATSDGRFSEMTGHYYPLKIHDRRER